MEECWSSYWRIAGLYPAGKGGHLYPGAGEGDANDLGIYVLRSDGRHYQAGDYKKRFTIQSVVKPILLLLALMDNGEDTVRARVGVEANRQTL